MEVILKKTIDTLGREGEIVQVKPGYARNYLIPQNMASTVTKASLARLQREQDAIESRRAEEKKNAEILAAQLENMIVVITRKVGNEGRLFGSVNSGDIVARLAEQGIILDKRAIMLADAIKSIGETKVTVKVGYQMTTEITVQVAPERETEVA
ncbi:50S ribosomal protein L9 [Candidatus Electrothrix sp.]|uniref:50S ribosomal protein L9 n=1 Tax=Candidatus Electrothrix sp. TaxID=2170559 RepID=UPI0040566675